MTRNRIEEATYRQIAEELDIDSAEVKRAVNSFFSLIVSDARKLPFDNHRRIYSKEKFEEYGVVRNMPFIGRIGPSYSRYLKWRYNESGNYPMALRGSFSKKMSQGEIEDIAASILSGGTPWKPKRLKGSDMFDRVWLVGKSGKKSARQVIPKEKK